MTPLSNPDPNQDQLEFSHFNSIRLKSQRAPARPIPFLFVVKTPSSGALSRSTTRSAAASINSHAQRWVQEAACSKAISQTQNSDTLLFENCVIRCRVDRLLDEDCKSSKGRRSGARKGNSVSRPSTKKCPTKTTKSSEELSTTPRHNDSATPPPEPNQDDVCEEPTRRPRIAVLGLSSLSTIDPFKCTSLELDAGVQTTLQYYLSFALLSTPQSSVDVCKSSAPGCGLRHCSTINAIIQGCMRESVHMYALLAATASRMRRVSGISFRPDNGPEIYLHKAIQSMRLLLDTEAAVQDRQIILDIYYLSVCEWYMESYAASRTHFNFLKHFWKSIDPGLSTFDQYISDMLSYVDVFLGPKTTEPSTLDTTSLPTRREAMDRSPGWRSSFAGHCSAFPSSLENKTYSQDLKDTVQELPPLLRVHSHVSQEFDFVGLDTDWIRSKSHSLMLRLLELPSYGGELCCRLALVLLLQQIFKSASTDHHSPPPSSSSSSSSFDKAISIDPVLITRRLKRQLQYEILLPSNEIDVNPTTTAFSQSIPPPLSDASSSTHTHNRSLTHLWTGKSAPLLLWILVTGLFASRTHSLPHEHHWFRTRALALMRLLGIDTWRRLRELVQGFLYVDGMLGDPAFETVFTGRDAADADKQKESEA